MRNGSGTYTPPAGSWTNPVNGQAATSGDWTALLNDLSAALTQSVSRDGQSPMTGNLNLGGNKITGLTAGTGTGQSLIFEQLFDQGTEQGLASAATTDIGAQLTNFLRITGTTTITSFGTNYKGPRFLRFEGAVTLTNGSALTLPGGANITTAAGDCMIVIPRATLGTADGWQVVAYQKNSNPSSPTFTDATVTNLTSTNLTSTNLTSTNLTVTNSINAPNTFGFKNRLINAQGLINQRGVSGTVVLTAGSYGHDRFKAGASGCTYTFSTSNNVTTFTISAGSLIQIIEGLNLESGSYILSWTGTAQGRVAGGSYGATGVIATVVGGTNTSIEFNTGTLSLPQFEKGSTATSFDYRPYGDELALCQRYYVKFNDSADSYAVLTQGSVQTTTGFYSTLTGFNFRATPTATYASLQIASAGAGKTISSITAGNATNGTVSLYIVSSSMTAGYSGMVQQNNSTSGNLQLSAEL